MDDAGYHLMSTLRLSYTENIPATSQSMLLDAALLLHDRPADQLRAAWASNLRAGSGLGELAAEDKALQLFEQLKNDSLLYLDRWGR